MSVPIRSSSPVQNPSLIQDFRAIFGDDGRRQEFNGFLTNVLLTVDPAPFHEVIQRHLDNPALVTDEQFYNAVQADLKPKSVFKSLFVATRALRSLGDLKGQMADQAKQLVRASGREAPIDGYIEMGGYGGRFVRDLQKAIPIKGTISIAQETAPGAAARIQVGFPGTFPFSQHVKVDDGESLIGEGKFQRESVDMVSCLGGLHHFDPTRLRERLQSIHDVLRPGGLFFVRDHHCPDSEAVRTARLAHTVFNLANSVPYSSETVDDESHEVRNFRSLPDWVNDLDACGFELVGKLDDTPMMVAGDPTANRMILFRRKPENLDQLKTVLRMERQYKRSPEQTYLTRPEWHNVDMAGELAEFSVRESWTQFPFLRHMVQQWSEFGKAWKSAQARHGFMATLTSEHTTMNLFISIMTTMQCLYLATIALIVRTLSGFSHRRSHMDGMIADMNQDYAQFIHHTPFYHYPVWNRIGTLWAELFKSPMTPFILKDFVATLAITLEMGLRGALSLPIQGQYSGDAKEPETVQVLVRRGSRRPRYFRELGIEPKAVRHWRFGGGRTQKHYDVIQIPRYDNFTKILPKLASMRGVEILEVCGHDHIQVKARGSVAGPTLQQHGGTVLSSCPILTPPPGQEAQAYHYYDVSVADLPGVLRKGTDRAAPEPIVYIHDF
ncbi:MAG: class I SAM-dependent methyltransferase [Chlamydiia bacterium]